MTAGLCPNNCTVPMYTGSNKSAANECRNEVGAQYGSTIAREDISPDKQNIMKDERRVED